MLARPLISLVFAAMFGTAAFAQQPGVPPAKPSAAKSPTAKTEPAPSPQKAPAADQTLSKGNAVASDAAEGKEPSEDEESDDARVEGSGLPVPRFVSLRSDKVNMRLGPGRQFEIQWVYHRKRLPVEVIEESEQWRKIRDPDGAEGWVFHSMLANQRTAVVRGSPQALRRNDGDDASVVATLADGVLVSVLRCPAGAPSCRVEVNGLQGWIKRESLWGVYPKEVVQ